MKDGGRENQQRRGLLALHHGPENGRFAEGELRVGGCERACVYFCLQHCMSQCSRPPDDFPLLSCCLQNGVVTMQHVQRCTYKQVTNCKCHQKREKAIAFFHLNHMVSVETSSAASFTYRCSPDDRRQPLQHHKPTQFHHITHTLSRLMAPLSF